MGVSSATSGRSARLRFPSRRRGGAKRRIQQGGVRADEEEIDSQGLDVPFDPAVLVQVGKRSSVELI